MMPAAPSRVILKFTLPENTCPGGVNNLMGLIIGPRGKTQQRLQEETNTVVAIRGRCRFAFLLFDIAGRDDRYLGCRDEPRRYRGLYSESDA